MTMNKKFTGIMPALVTPLQADETINVPVLERLMGDLLQKGADGFYIGGATGEGIALRREVRETLAEESVRIVNHKKPCIVHVAAAQYSETIALAKHAERCGADAISAVPPIYFKYDADDVYNYYKGISDAVHIPIMMYYSPAVNFTFTAEIVKRMFEIENITAIKWTSSNYAEMVRLKEMTHGDLNIFNGPDEMLLMGLSAGADGGIGTTYNCFLPEFKAVFAAYHRGDMATALQIQESIDRKIHVLTSYMTIPATKVVLEEMGYAVGHAAFPMKRYSEAQRAEICDKLRAEGFTF